MICLQKVVLQSHLRHLALHMNAEFTSDMLPQRVILNNIPPC